MNVHEINPKKTLGVLTVLVIVVIIGFLTMRPSRYDYKLNVNQSIQLLKDTSESNFYPYELVDVLNHKNKNVVLIDLRNKYAFGRGHIPGALSIPSFDLTHKKNLRLLKDYKKNGLTVVLYSNNQLSADGPWFFFRQIGFNNVRVLLGGYNYFLKHKNNLAATRSDNSYIKGIERFNYAKVSKSSDKSFEVNQNNKPKPVIFKRRKREAVAAGGC